MNRFVLLDENSNVINEIKFEDDFSFNETETIIYSEEDDVPISFSSLKANNDVSTAFASLGSDYGFDVLLPWENDFLIIKSGDLFPKFCGIPIDKIEGKLFGKTFSYFVELGYLNIFSEVLKSGISQNCKLQYFEDGFLKLSYRQDFVKFEDKLLIVDKDETDYESRILREYNLFYSSNLPMIILQDYKVVRVNNAYIKLINRPKDHILNLPFNFFTYDLLGLSDEDLVQLYHDVLNREIMSTQQVVRYNYEAEEYNNTKTYFKITAISTSFNNRPAVQITCEDITRSMLLENEAFRVKKI